MTKIKSFPSEENKQRAERASRTVAYYGALVGQAELRTNIVDLLTDIRHLARKRHISLGDVLEQSMTHYLEEVDEKA